jgi:hypothetical protein
MATMAGTSPAVQGRINSLFLHARDRAPDRVEGETASLQEADLLRTLRCARRGFSEALLPCCASPIDLGRARCVGHASHRRGTDAFRAQLVRDPRRTELRRERVGTRVRIAIVGEELAADEIIEERFDLAGILGAARQLARELRT